MVTDDDEPIRLGHSYKSLLKPSKLSVARLAHDVGVELAWAPVDGITSREVASTWIPIFWVVFPVVRDARVRVDEDERCKVAGTNRDAPREIACVEDPLGRQGLFTYVGTNFPISSPSIFRRP